MVETIQHLCQGNIVFPQIVAPLNYFLPRILSAFISNKVQVFWEDHKRLELSSNLIWHNTYSAYVATSTKSDGVRIDGLLPPNTLSLRPVISVQLQINMKLGHFIHLCRWKICSWDFFHLFRWKNNKHVGSRMSSSWNFPARAEPSRAGALQFPSWKPSWQYWQYVCQK